MKLSLIATLFLSGLLGVPACRWYTIVIICCVEDRCGLLTGQTPPLINPVQPPGLAADGVLNIESCATNRGSTFQLGGGGTAGRGCVCPEVIGGIQYQILGDFTTLSRSSLWVERSVWDSPNGGLPPGTKLPGVDVMGGAYIGGDPHIKTWGGEWYDWQGECDAVMLHAPDFGRGMGLTIHIRTKIRYDYSYIESAAIKIGDEILEVSAFGQYFLNGVSHAELPTLVSDFFITHKEIDKDDHVFVIDLGHDATLAIKSHKDIVSIGIDGHGPNNDFLQWFTNSTGLMGSFLTGEMLARDGVTILTDPNEMGQEWQVLDSEPMLFQFHEREPQYPQKCLLPTSSAKEARRRLGESISREAAEKACGDWKTEDAKERCIYDVMATGDLEMAMAGSY